jgi:Spy/CpxP family protein refolding chaperone
MHIVHTLSAVLLAAAVAIPVYGQAPAPHASAGAGEHHGHWHHRDAGPFFHDLRKLNLSADQKSQIKQLVRAAFANGKTQFASLRQARRAFETAVPGTPAFTSAETALEQAETAAVGPHLQNQANLRSRIYALLTDAQKTQLAGLLAQTPVPAQPDDH